MSIDSRTITSQIISRSSRPVVSRVEAARLSGGLVTPKTLANLDSQGLGPGARVRYGKKIGYPVEEFARWLADRIQPISPKSPNRIANHICHRIIY